MRELPRQSCLEQQRDVAHDDRGAGLTSLRDGDAAHLLDGRMHDRLERTPRIGVGKNVAAERDPIERTIGQQHVLAKVGHDRGQRRRVRRHGGTRGGIAVDQGRAARGERGGHGRFPRRDVAGEGDDQHLDRLLVVDAVHAIVVDWPGKCQNRPRCRERRRRHEQRDAHG